MSMLTSMVYGYGFEVKGIPFNTIIRFAYKHRNTLAELTGGAELVKALDAIAKSRNNFDDVPKNCCPLSSDDNNIISLLNCLATFTSYHNDSWGGDYDSAFCEDINYVNIIKDVFNAEHPNIQLSFEPGKGYQGEPSVLLPERKPWDMTNEERCLTKQDFRELLLPYITELGLELDCLENLAIEYFG